MSKKDYTILLKRDTVRGLMFSRNISSYEKLGKIINVSKASIVNAFNDKRLGGSVLAKLCGYFNVPMDVIAEIKTNEIKTETENIKKGKRS
jgi:hypothetical protein